MAPLANVLFDAESPGTYGGSEIRAWTLARALARIPGFDVTLIVQGNGSATVGIRDGVTVMTRDFAAPARRSGLVSRLRGMMRRGIRGERETPAADVVCAFGAVLFNAQLAEICRRQRQKFALLLGSDIDVAGNLAEVLAGRRLDELAPREEARAALLAADLVVAQTVWQARRVEEATGRKAVIVPSPVDLGHPLAPESEPRRTEILWVGKTDQIKRPQLALEVARRVPNLRFRIVVNPSDRRMWNELATAAPANVALMERFAFADADQIYGRALVLLNTSAFEGFPNAFLQAGRHGVPVVSAGVDPDGFLRRTGSGVVAGPDPASLARAIRQLTEDPQEWRRASENIRTYVAGHHDSASCAMALARCLERLVAEPRGHLLRSIAT